MPVVEVGSPPSQGVGGIPTKYLIIGAGVIAVAGLLIWQRRAPAATSSDTSGDVQPTGSVSAELSSVQQMQLQQFGELTKLFAAQSDQIASGTSSITGGIGNLSTQIDTQAGALSSALSGVASQVSGVAGQVGGVSGQVANVQAGINSLATGQAQLYQQGANDFNTLMAGIWQTFMRASNPYADISNNPYMPPPENQTVATH